MAAKEIFKDIKGFDRYRIGNHGTVISDKRMYGSIMSQSRCKKGYPRIRLMTGRFRKTIRIHRLVALNFIDNPDNLPQVNHKDGVKTNNHVSNLEWCTNDYNRSHAIKNGLIPKNVSGDGASGSLLMQSDAYMIRLMYKSCLFKQSELADIYNIDQASISRLLRNETYTDNLYVIPDMLFIRTSNKRLERRISL